MREAFCNARSSFDGAQLLEVSSTVVVVRGSLEGLERQLEL